MVFHSWKQISLSTCATLTEIPPEAIQSFEIVVPPFVFFSKGKLYWRSQFMNSLEFNANTVFRCWNFYWERGMKKKIFKNVESLIWGRVLNGWERTQADRPANSAHHPPSSVPSPVWCFGGTWGERKARAVVSVWLSWDTMKGKQSKCALFIIHTLFLYALLTFWSALTSKCKLHVYEALGINSCYLCAQIISESQAHCGC